MKVYSSTEQMFLVNKDLYHRGRYMTIFACIDYTTQLDVGNVYIAFDHNGFDTSYKSSQLIK